jgi:hypothetical protein
MPRGEYVRLRGNFGTVAAGAISISSPADARYGQYAMGDVGAGGAGPRPGGEGGAGSTTTGGRFADVTDVPKQGRGSAFLTSAVICHAT